MTAYQDRPRSRSRAWRPALWAVLAVLLAVLPACTGIPTDQVPRPGQPVLGAPRQDVQSLPEGPRVGASPEDIVLGFLQANASFADGHEIARAYLTQDLASSWVPTEHVLVHRGDRELVQADTGEVEVGVEARGVLGEDRRLRELPTGTRRSERFSLALVGGEWRIETFPEDFGLWLSEADFEQEFRAASIAYVSPVQDVLVPDVRWFPIEGGLPTALARALLQPLPDELDGAVRTAVPDGTELVGGAVPVDTATGIATVDLSGPGPSEDPELARMLWAQLTHTLTQAGGVQEVAVEINGQPLLVPGVQGPAAAAGELGYALPDLGVDVVLLRTGSELTRVDPGDFALRNLAPVPGDAPQLPQVPVRWTSPATNADLDEFAAVSGDGTVLWRWRDGSEVERSDIGVDLTAPHFDSTGSLWLAGRSATGPRIWAISTSAPLEEVARRVEADWLGAGQVIEALKVSADAQRAVVLLLEESTGEQTLGLTGIVRDREGNPLRLTEPRTIAPVLTSVQSLAWSSPTSLLVLGQRAEDEVDLPYEVSVDGWVQALRAETGAEEVRVLPTGQGPAPVLLTGEGGVFTREGAGWYAYRNADDLIVPLG